MRSTLFYIPHQIGPLPLFGFGWALIALVIAWIVSQLLRARRPSDASQEGTTLISWGIVAAIIAFAVPHLESSITFADGKSIKLGIPVRGYGLMLIVAIIAGCYWSYQRGKRFGLGIDALFSLAFWGMIGGIGGARLFYVVQKWSEFESPNLSGKLLQAMQFTEGGLVVYGGVIGGLLATGIWCFIRNRSFFQLADIVTPGFLMGLAIGRVGCLLNGCCYGGVCDVPLPAIVFPPGSPPYTDQLYNGQLIGVEYNSTSMAQRQLSIDKIKPQSWAAENMLSSGDQIAFTSYPDTENPASSPEVVASILRASGATQQLPLPAASLPVHPSQIYATINAGILSFLLASLPFSYRLRGTIFGAALILYGFSRSIEEIIRVDELGQFGTIFSIGQWVSALGILCGTILIAFRLLANRQTENSLYTAPSGI